MNIEQAKSIPLQDFLRCLGQNPDRCKGSELWYKSPCRNETSASFKVDTGRNLWYDFGLGKGGSIIELAMLCFHVSDISSVLKCISQTVGNRIIPTACVPVQTEDQSQHSSFTGIREVALHNGRLIEYAINRGIPADIARSECVEVHFKLHGNPRFAMGFKNRSGGYELRNPKFKASTSPKDISIRKSDRTDICSVFEGFFDYLSWLSDSGGIRQTDVIVLNSVANLDRALPLLHSYPQVEVYFDNDDAGRAATIRLRQSLEQAVVTDKSPLYYGFNDYNEWHATTQR